MFSPTTAEAFGKYRSQEQAMRACYEWANNGGKFKYWAWQYSEGRFEDLLDSSPNEYEGKWIVAKKDKRFCDLETETRQMLGKERMLKNNFKKGVWWMYRVKDHKIKKHFRY